MSTLFSHFFSKINQIRPLEADFTEVLEPIALKPKTLYFYGKMPENVTKKDGSLERPRSVAIVGSRRNSRYGAEVAYKMAYELAKRGVVIISGLAFGIDSIGHQAALDAGGTTVAVLGTPINEIYPRSHTRLASDIVEKGGAIISEYAPRTPEYREAPLGIGESGLKNGKWRSSVTKIALESPETVAPPFEERRLDPKTSFLYRNRLISGLADIVVVVEAADRSGTLNTAAHALDQGKTVFAVPGNLTSPLSVGCNRLIAQGATPYVEPDDLLKLLFPEEFVVRRARSRSPQGDTPLETAILQNIQDGARSGEDIMQNLSLDVTTFNQTITFLEVKNLVRPLGANRWALV